MKSVSCLKDVFCVQTLTSPRQDTADGSVTDGSITGLNVHERFAAHSHEHPLLHTQLWNITFIHSIFLNL